MSLEIALQETNDLLRELIELIKQGFNQPPTAKVAVERLQEEIEPKVLVEPKVSALQITYDVVTEEVMRLLKADKRQPVLDALAAFGVATAKK